MTIINGRFVGDAKGEIRNDMFQTLQDNYNGTLNPDNIGVVIELLDTYAEVLAIFESEMRTVLDSAHLEHAEGQALDYLVELKGVYRREPTKSDGIQEFYFDSPHDVDVFIPQGTTVQTDATIPTRFETDEKARLLGSITKSDSNTYTTTNTSFVTKVTQTVDVSGRDSLDVTADYRTTDSSYTSYIEIADSTNATVITSDSTTSTSTITVGPTSYDVSGLDGDIAIEYRIRVGNSSGSAELSYAETSMTGQTSVNVPVTAVEAGSDGNVGASNVTDFFNTRPHADLETTNPSAIDGGRDEEEDEDLRERAKLAVDDGAKATLPALLQSLRGLKNLESATLYYNDTDTDGGNGYGLPRQTVEPLLVYNSDDWQPVWDALAENKAACEPTVGGYNGNEKTGTATLENGQDISITISEPNEVDIWIEIDIDYIKENFEGTKKIKDNLVDYIGGYHTNGEYENTGLPVGNDVIYDDLKYLVMDVDGVYDINSLTVGKSENPTGTSNIAIANNENTGTDARPSTSQISIETNEVEGPS